MGAVTQAKRLRMILSGMFGLAVRHDVMAVNPNEVLAIEWPERWVDPPPIVYDVRIEHRGGDRRLVRIRTPPTSA